MLHHATELRAYDYIGNISKSAAEYATDHGDQIIIDAYDTSSWKNYWFGIMLWNGYFYQLKAEQPISWSWPRMQDKLICPTARTHGSGIGYKGGLGAGTGTSYAINKFIVKQKVGSWKCSISQVPYFVTNAHYAIYAGTAWDKRTYWHNKLGSYAFLDGSVAGVSSNASHPLEAKYWYNGQQAWR